MLDFKIGFNFKLKPKKSKI
ncbi:Hypothetical protein KK9_0368 [Borreliella garinii BgVir]|nr:Hypothetical protein KK9_0368 [Borreliella garinii BgVir]